jgi:hypothetical protein
MRLKIMSSKFVAIPSTLGIVFQERGVIRFCFIWFHVVFDMEYKKLPRGSWRAARGVLQDKTPPNKA